MKTVEKIKEKPILFSSESIKSLLSGDKTQTRRVIKSIYNNVYEDQGYIHIMDTADLNKVKFDKDKSVAQFILQTKVDDSDIFDKVKSKYQVGDILYVKQPIINIFLKVTDVKIQRVRDISEDDILKEGIRQIVGDKSWRVDGEYRPAYPTFKNRYICFSARQSFECLWDKLYKQKPWRYNPFVWVYSFEVLKNYKVGG